MKLLTIDADWAVDPTPMQALPGQETSQTLESLIYDFGGHLDGRPDDESHRILSAKLAAKRLKRAGLRYGLETIQTVDHGGISSVWPDDVLQRVDRIVCLDAHLDVYPMMTLDLMGGEGDPILSHYHVYQFLTHRGPKGERIDDTPAGQAITKLLQEPLYLERAWVQAWLLLLLDRLPNLTIFDWVVPDHFAPALEQGFPYPDAQWMTTLRVGQSWNTWSFSLRKAQHSILLHVASIPTQRRRKKRHRLEINLHSLEQVDLSEVSGPIHLCHSPQHIPPKADTWVDELEQELNTPKEDETE